MRTKTRLLFMAAALASGGAIPASGQTTQTARSASAPAAAVGAVLGGAGGLFAGGILGGGSDCYEICDATVYGAVAGEIIGVALGAHLLNRGRGRFLVDFLASSTIGMLGVQAVRGSSVSEGAMLISTGLAQVVAVVLTEVHTSPRLQITPTVYSGRDGPGVGLSVQW